MVLGLTGPPGAGKSVVLGWMRDRGAEVLDADAVVKDVLDQDREVVNRIAARFGLPAGRAIDRAALAGIVFADDRALADLESIIHPVVSVRIHEWIKRLAGTVGVVEAIKLTQSDLAAWCESVWLVTCDKGVRLERLRLRGWTDQESARRSRAAPSLGHELVLASVVIDNSGPWSHTCLQLEAAWRSKVSTHGGDS
jgi:dephospho-CoA kinase